MIFRLSVLSPPWLFFRSLSASVATFLRCSSLSPHHCLPRYLLLPVHPQSPLSRLYNLLLHPLLVLFTGASVLSFHSPPPLSLSLSNPLLSFPLQSPFDFLHTESGSISSTPLPPSPPWRLSFSFSFRCSTSFFPLPVFHSLQALVFSPVQSASTHFMLPTPPTFQSYSEMSTIVGVTAYLCFSRVICDLTVRCECKRSE